MQPSSWTTEHDLLLSELAPGTSEPTEAEVEGLWTRVSADMDRRHRPHRRALRITVGAAVGAVVLGSAGVATAQFYSAHTGKGPVDVHDLRQGGPGERLDPAGSDYGRVIAKATRKIPFPDARSRAIAIQDQVDDQAGARPGESLTATGAVQSWVAKAAVCAWSNRWAAATATGDIAARDEAVRTILEAPTWPSVTAVDPAPYNRTQTITLIDAKTKKKHTRRVRDESLFYWLAPLGKAVQGGDRAAVAAILSAEDAYCSPGLVPDIPEANPMSGGR